MALMMNLFLTLGTIVLDIVAIAASGIGAISIGILIRYLLTAVSSFVAATLAIRIMRQLAQEKGYALFGLYCLGVAMFTFVLNLLA